MGLDMYLQKRNKKTGDLIDKELVYWRKANQIRAWLVKNAGYPDDANMLDYPLSKEILEKLKTDCKTVVENFNLASKILPTSSGFFFGDTQYDDWYYDTVKRTAKELDRIIKETDFDKEEIIYLEWW